MLEAFACEAFTPHALVLVQQSLCLLDALQSARDALLAPVPALGDQTRLRQHQHVLRVRPAARQSPESTSSP